jgi:hypothetical protein
MLFIRYLQEPVRPSPLLSVFFLCYLLLKLDPWVNLLLIHEDDPEVKAAKRNKKNTNEKASFIHH